MSAVETTDPVDQLVELERHEAIIERGLQSFVEVGNALIAIKAGKLYKQRGYDSFDTYVEDRFGLKSSQRVRLMTAAATHEGLVRDLTEIAPTGAILPTSERQVRPLAQLEPEQRADAWSAAVEAAEGGQPTAAQVEDSIRRKQAIAQLTKADQERLDAWVGGNWRWAKHILVGEYRVATVAKIALPQAEFWQAEYVNRDGMGGGKGPRRETELHALGDGQEFAAFGEPLGGDCSVCGEPVVMFDGDDRCAQCIETAEANVVAPGAPTGTQPATGGDPVSSPVALVPGVGDAPHREAGGVQPPPSPPTSPTPAPSAAEEASPPAASSAAITPDEVIAPPKPAKEKPTQREQMIADYVKHLRRIAAAYDSLKWLGMYDDLTTGYRTEVDERLTEAEGLAIVAFRQAVGL